MSLSRRVGVVFVSQLVLRVKERESCFQLNAKRLSGMSIYQQTHQDLTGAASARGMRLHSVTLGLQLFDRNLVLTYTICGCFMTL